jgi:UDP-N-acetylmuramoyl-tripeptide--D-alanyl-D-alanine ligase
LSDWTSDRVAAALGAPPGEPQRFSRIGTDSRTLEPGALFVALAGERFDGHEFLSQAKERGALGAVVRTGTGAVPGLATFEVDDTLVALGELARARRREIQGPVVAVTGTNGKTATKEMLARALGARWRVHATRGNLNNLIGVPLTILAAPDDAEALVIEAGASVPGEIERLRRIVEPTLAVVTNVSTGHVEGFGSLEGVLDEKVSLLADVPTAVVGTEPPELAERARAVAVRVVAAGTGSGADVRPDVWRLDGDGRPEIMFKGVSLRLPLIGRHQVENAMLALCVAVELGVDIAAAAETLSDIELPPGRCQLLEHDDLVVMNDAYNSNPASLGAALETAAALRGGRPLVVVVGTMLELGSRSDGLHESMAERVMRVEPALVAAVGAFVPAFEPHRAALGDRLLTAADPASLGKLLGPRLKGDEFVLMKASRGVQLERAIPFLMPDGD